MEVFLWGRGWKSGSAEKIRCLFLCELRCGVEVVFDEIVNWSMSFILNVLGDDPPKFGNLVELFLDFRVFSI